MYADFFITMAKVLGIMIASFVVMLVLAIAFLQILVKRLTRNRIYAIFIDQKKLYSALLLQEDEHIFYGKGDKKEQYDLDPNSQFWVNWPPVATNLIGTPVRAHCYIRNRSTPINLGKPSPTNNTAKTNRMLSDQAMMKSMWNDVRQEVGLPRVGAMGPPSLTLILIFACVVVSAFTLWMVMDLKTVVGAIAQISGVR